MNIEYSADVTLLDVLRLRDTSTEESLFYLNGIQAEFQKKLKGTTYGVIPSDQRDFLDDYYKDGGGYDEYRRKGFLSLTEEERHTFLRATFVRPYSVARGPTFLDAHRAISFYVISEYLSAFLRAIEDGSILLILTNARGFIEKAASIYTLSLKLTEFFDSHPRPMSNIDSGLDEFLLYLHEFYYFVSEATKGTKLKWHRYMHEGSIRIPKNKAGRDVARGNTRQTYEPAGILQSVSKLDKAIFGAESAYNYLCEYVHPSIAHFFLYNEGCDEQEIAEFDLRYEQHFYSGEAPVLSYAAHAVPVTDLISLLVDTCKLLSQVDKDISSQGTFMYQVSKRLVKSYIKQSGMFVASDPCPCGSGSPVVKCCGKKIKHALIDKERRT